MKKIITSVLILILLVQAKGIKKISHKIFELGPKASFYISDDAYFGIGAECVINPVKSVGIRLNITELIFGNGTRFYLNSGGAGFSGTSLEGLFYIPMTGINPYVHGGLGFDIFDPPGRADTQTFLFFGFGMGLNYLLNPSTKVFVEPGIIIYDAHNTETIFRLSFGARFGVL